MEQVGLVLAVGSGIPIGKEGPFVHIACMVASLLVKLPFFDHIKQVSCLPVKDLCLSNDPFAKPIWCSVGRGLFCGP
jgi:hypothetical protein